MMTNFMYKGNGEGHSYYPSSEAMKYYQEQLTKLDPKKTSDTAQYIELKTQLDLYELMKQYEKGSWQINIVGQQAQTYLNEINTLTYGTEKNEQGLRNVTEKYEALLQKLSTDDWTYFAKEEQKELAEKIRIAEEQEKKTEDKIQLQEIENNLNSLKIQKQVVDWRLEKNISYADSYYNNALESYTNFKNSIYLYEQQPQHSYQEQQDYKQALEKAGIAQYSIEHGVEAGNKTNNRGILMRFCDEFEILIIMMIVMVAGSIVSDEFSKGTIKLLLVRPYKRTKILAAKFIACFLILAMSILAIVGLQYIIGGIIQGFDSTQIPAVIYNHNTNQVETMNLIAYIGVTTLAKLPMLILIMTVAFVCSTIFTNTAVSIVIPLFGYMGAPILLQLAIAYDIQILKYFPTLNWDLTSYLFGGLPEFQYTNLGFSIIVSIFYFIAILVPTFIIFKKKNIKNI